MRYFIGSDHAGFNIKQNVIEMLESRGHEVFDLGPRDNNRVDYPDFAKEVCKKVAEDSGSFGVLICGSGIGMSIAANKINGIRAALCTDAYMAKMTRAHNDANVLCLGERVTGLGVVESIIEAFCSTEFEGGRHACRIGKIE